MKLVKNIYIKSLEIVLHGHKKKAKDKNKKE